MPPEPPLWRRAYTAIERAIEPRADAAVRADEFAAALARLSGTRRALRKAIDSRTRGIWHLLNLPAGTDVRTLRRQIGELDREIRLLRAELDRSRREEAAGKASTGKASTRKASTGKASTGKASSTTQRKARSRGGDSGK